VKRIRKRTNRSIRNEMREKKRIEIKDSRMKEKSGK
jgi:hypothetical protein